MLTGVFRSEASLDLDEASAVDFVLLNEPFKNQEAFNTSTYVAHGESEKWALGPLWDVDLAMGNLSYGPASVLLADVAMIANRLGATGAAARDFRRWPVLGKVIWPNPRVALNRKTYAGEVNALTAWLTRRIAWLDDYVHRIGAQHPARAGATTTQ